MKKLKLARLMVMLLSVGFVVSCGPSSLIQKRKYTKGWHVSNVSKKAKSHDFESPKVEAEVTELKKEEMITDSKEKAFIPVTAELLRNEKEKVASNESATIYLEASIEFVKEKVNEASEETISKVYYDNQTYFPEVKNIKKKSAVEEKETESEGKSQLVALLLILFFGGLGIHRFYLGYPVIAIIQIITIGGFGIWYIIDLIRIIKGTLKPKNGEYETTL